MPKIIKVLWYIGVAAAATMVVTAFCIKNWPLSIASLVLGVMLQKTNKFISLARVYEELGVINSVFEGKVRNEKNN